MGEKQKILDGLCLQRSVNSMLNDSGRSNLVASLVCLCIAFLLQRLERIEQQCSGCLFGVFYDEGTLLLMGFNVESTIGQLNYEQIQYKFPAELDLCGLVKFGDCTDAEAHLNEVLKDVDITDNPILLQRELGTLVGFRASILMHGKLQEIPYDVMGEEELYRDFCFTRLRCCLGVYLEQEREDVRRQMHAQRKLLSSGGVAFRIEPSNYYVTNTGITKHPGEQPISLLLRSVAEAVATTGVNGLIDSNKDSKRETNNTASADLPKLSSTYGALGTGYDVVNIEVLRCQTRDRVSDLEMDSATTKATNIRRSVGGTGKGRSNLAPPAVSMCLQHNESRVLVPIEVEAMAMLYKHTQLNRLYDILIESICRALRLYELCMLDHLTDYSGAQESQSKEDRKTQLFVPQGYHFSPQEFGHFVTCAYPAGIADDDSRLQDKRKRLHRHFGLPGTQPYFRRTNCCRFRNEMHAFMPLYDTHIGVRPSGVIDGVQSLVRGHYQYYHYLQQQIQDKGWGCAYRSLQTLCSWFLLQGYTEREVPNHKEIQEYLVRIGDKPSTFLGSSQWIGSAEVSMCLQGFLNVDSRIQHVSSGAELRTFGPELVQHFQTQGTPVMVGGGVLAHTIIGVDYCAQSEQLKFLILDPHYTGSEDLHTIQSKGWCGWKGIDFWDKKSYYNLCLPQRPILF